MIYTLTTNFKIVPIANPKRDPKAIFSGFASISILAPIKAPIKAPNNIPIGGNKIIPNNIPTNEPLIAYLPPPALLTP